MTTNNKVQCKYNFNEDLSKRKGVTIGLKIVKVILFYFLLYDDIDDDDDDAIEDGRRPPV